MIVTVPENDTAAPSEPAANSSIAGGATTVSNSTSNVTANSSSNITGNSSDDTSASPTVNLTGPSA